MATVELYETQLGFLDRVVESGEHGDTREAVLRAVILRHVDDRLGGASDHVGGTARPDVLTSAFPDYGERRLEYTLEPVTGQALVVRRGEVLRIEQAEGGTCVDFNAFNLHDHKEFLDCGFTRSFQSFDPRRGEFIWTNAPRGRPMFAILEIAGTCELDIVGHRCNRVFQELGWGMTTHANWQDTLAEAIREYGLTPDDVHDSFNLWMATTIDTHGRREFRWTPARRGDRIDLLAQFDVLAASAICGLGDLVASTTSRDPGDAGGLRGLGGDRRPDRGDHHPVGRMESQSTEADLSPVPVLADRELRRDAEYVPAYRPVPGLRPLEVELGAPESGLVAGLIATAVYGETEGEAIRAAFMRWCNAHLTRVRRPFLDLATSGMTARPIPRPPRCPPTRRASDPSKRTPARAGEPPGADAPRPRTP